MLPARHHLAGILGLVVLLFLCGLTAWPTAAPPPGAGRPRLAVLLVFDQLRGDYPERWRPLFGDGGFRRLEAEGAWFRNCHYPYSDTYTGAGHASVATGCAPDRHGIIGNDWYDRAAHEPVYCVDSLRYEPVPPRPQRPADRKKKVGVAPEHLLVPTLGDSLKAATGGRVVSLSFKDRSAVLPGGHHPDACYWFDTATGRFETSTYYRDSLHPWVAAFNREPFIGHWFGGTWTRLRPDLDYALWSGPDDVVGEGPDPKDPSTRVFPHSLGRVPLSPAAYYNALYASPYGNEVLLELTRRAVEALGLGTRDVPDLLCVSFSSNDVVGHAWGPDSQEVLDVTLRTDRLIDDLLTLLDDKVGRDRYVVALTADHGVCPLPEVSRAQGKEAGRLKADEVLKKQADRFLRDTFGGSGTEEWVEAQAEEWVYLNQATIARHGLRPAEVEAALAGWLEQQRGIGAAFTRTRLLEGGYADSVLGRRLRRSFHPVRSGNVAAVPKPYFIWFGETGTSHGTPHDYDTHVPLMVSGPGVRGGSRWDAVTPLAAAVILAEALGIPPPSGAAVGVPPHLIAR
jgi:hypothetical protein